MIFIQKNTSKLNIFIYRIINKSFAIMDNIRWRSKYQSCINKFEFIGKGVVIDYNVLILGAQNISIGDNVFIGRNVIINAAREAKIKIGRGCGIGAGSTIMTWNPDLMKHRTIDRRNNKSNLKDVIIGDGVGLGYNVTINPGVTLGNGCQVAAGSVVVGESNDFEVLGGVPAKVIATRKEIK